MREQKNIEMMHRIDDYICSRLSQVEIDELWIEFLREPEWFYYFETYLHLLELAKRLKKLN